LEATNTATQCEAIASPRGGVTPCTVPNLTTTFVVAINVATNTRANPHATKNPVTTLVAILS